MAIKSDFDEGRSMNELLEKADQIRERIIAAMHMTGESFIANARGQVQDHSAGTYVDQTTNLRNSIQYLIFYRGELLEESESTNTVVNRQDVQELLNNTGYQLIGIAGMNYASWVESKGYNVISNQSDTCIIDLTSYFKDIQEFVNHE